MTMPPALQRALELLADPPEHPDVSKGYLDLLSAGPSAQEAAAPKNTGPLQAVFASRLGSAVYDHAQVAMRRLFAAWLNPTRWLTIPAGGIALDVGCGPGSITASLAAAVGSGGLVLGVDISESMLARAVRTDFGPQVAFLRADAQRLPLRDETVDAVVCIAVLQLVPQPAAALAEITRVLRPGGRLALMVPTAGPAARIGRLLPGGWAYVFGEDELGDLLEDRGFVSVRVKTFGTFQSVRAQRG
ncbi:MAG: methyltransferase domain-containing protein [Mycobacterium sp.]|nr:methyltransferase domain-containing protein [Mycobacterium sp.]